MSTSALGLLQTDLPYQKFIMYVLFGVLYHKTPATWTLRAGNANSLLNNCKCDRCVELAQFVIFSGQLYLLCDNGDVQYFCRVRGDTAKVLFDFYKHKDCTCLVTKYSFSSLPVAIIQSPKQF